MICPWFVARELTAPADGGVRGMVDREVRHALCPGRRGAHDESSRGADASDQWTTDLAAGGGHPGLAAPQPTGDLLTTSGRHHQVIEVGNMTAAFATARGDGGGTPRGPAAGTTPTGL